MWRFLCFLLVLVPFTGAQTLIVTFGDDSVDKIELKEKSGISYNVISNKDNATEPFFQIPASTLKNTDGSDFDYALSVAPIDAGKAKISSFSGDDVTMINELFGLNSISGVLSQGSETMLNFKMLKAGSYTLSVLAARGDSMQGKEYLTTYYLDCSSLVDIKVNATVIASHTSTWEISENSTKVKALTVNTSGESNKAENWVLMQFDVTLLNDVKNLKLCASGNYGNVAAVAFSVVPEPTSSVLSVLALSAMVSRRRRLR